MRSGNRADGELGSRDRVRKRRFRKIRNCVFSAVKEEGEELSAVDEMMSSSSESLATKDYNVESAHSSRNAADKKPDTRNIEEAELSLRESGYLNYEEARALLGRYEYQKGNIEAALHVFEGIDIAAVAPNMKITLSKKVERRKRRSQDHAAPPMSIHAVSLLLEAVYLKAKSLQGLGRFKEAAESCKIVLDVVESSRPEGLPENFGSDSKLHDILSKAVELLPELWKLADCSHDAILSYRRALLHYWNLDAETTARLQKEFAIYLLYNGDEASPPDLRSQMESSFVPKSNLEEAILLLKILLRKASLKRIGWDPSILDHLSYALSVSGNLKALADQVEELLPGIIARKERYYTLALCYTGAREYLVALNLLRKLLNNGEDPKCIPALLMASKICGERPKLGELGISLARRAAECLDDGCCQLDAVVNHLLGISLSACSKFSISDSERAERESEALHVLETAGRLTKLRDPKIIYHLALENAEQRKLDIALYYAKHLLKLEGGSNLESWLLLSRILSALRRFVDAETIINAALDQTTKWDQGELLRTKAKLQIAQDQLKSAIETYTQLLAILQVQNKNFAYGKKLFKEGKSSARDLELKIWHDLAYVYINLSQWRDAETCLSKSNAISSYSASRYHAAGSLYEAKGLLKEALRAYENALGIDPAHVPSLVSLAVVLRKFDNKSLAVIRSFLMAALRLDKTNHSAWYNLGLLYKEEGTASSLAEAIECFQAASYLEDSAPVEPFR